VEELAGLERLERNVSDELFVAKLSATFPGALRLLGIASKTFSYDSLRHTPVKSVSNANLIVHGLAYTWIA
jgi:hypothetical protein